MGLPLTIIPVPSVQMIQFLRSLLSKVPRAPEPLTVDSAVAQLSSIEDRLKTTYETNRDLASRHRILASAAEYEMDRALRVSSKINSLLS